MNCTQITGWKRALSTHSHTNTYIIQTKRGHTQIASILRWLCLATAITTVSPPRAPLLARTVNACPEASARYYYSSSFSSFGARGRGCRSFTPKQPESQQRRSRKRRRYFVTCVYMYKPMYTRYSAYKIVTINSNFLFFVCRLFTDLFLFRLPVSNGSPSSSDEEKDEYFFLSLHIHTRRLIYTYLHSGIHVNYCVYR